MPRRQLDLAFAFLTVFASLLSAQAPLPKPVVSIEGITEYRLDNGLKILLFPDRSRPTVTVNLTALVGSRHEGYGETGMAHLLEHMLFKGTPTHRNIPKELQDRGAQFNGTTNYDRTNYFETLPASDENLDWALGLEADRLVNSFVKRDDLLSEFSVVRNEFERGENSPTNVLMQRMMAAAFEWHNYGKTTIGNRTDIERVPIDRLQAFYRKYYQPDNAVLVVAGKFEPSKALMLIEKHFGRIPRPKRELDKTYTEEPPQDGERTVVLRRVGESGAVGVLYHVPAASHPDFQAVDVLADVLTNPPNGALYKALVGAELAVSVSGGAQDLHDPGVIAFQASTSKSQNIDKARQVMLAVLESVGKSAIDAKEVDASKRRFLSRRELAEANTTGIAIGLSSWAARGDWRLYFLSRDRMEKVTADQVRRVAAQYMVQSNRTVGIFVPTAKPVRSAIPGAANLAEELANYSGRKKLVEGEAFDPTPANIEARVQRGELPGGVKYALLPKKNRGETVELTLQLHFGNAENLKGKVEAAGLMGQAMMFGTKELSRQQIQDELSKASARLMLRAGGGTLTATISTKRASLPRVLEILRQVLREPAFPEKELEVAKRRAIDMAQRAKSEPMALAMQALGRQLTSAKPGDVRYAPTADERIARIGSIQRSQVVEVQRDFLGGRHGELAVVGDFDRGEVLAGIAKIVSGWDAKQPYERVPQPAPPPLTRKSQTIDTPDKANAFYVAGTAFGLKESDPDYPALMLGNQILGGGGLSSRLGDRLRQKDGLSYTVQSMCAVNPEDQYGTLMMLAIANPANIPRVQRGMAEEIARLLKDGVTAEELARAKRSQQASSKVARTRDGALAGMLATGLRLGRTMQYYDDMEKRMSAVTVEQVNAALRKYVDPNRLIVVTAGDFPPSKAPKT